MRLGVWKPRGAPLVKNHEYMVVGVNKSANGTVTSVVLRNPWGYDGKGNDADTSDGLVTISAALLFNCTGQVYWSTPVA